MYAAFLTDQRETKLARNSLLSLTFYYKVWELWSCIRYVHSSVPCALYSLFVSNKYLVLLPLFHFLAFQDKIYMYFHLPLSHSTNRNIMRATYVFLNFIVAIFNLVYHDFHFKILIIWKLNDTFNIFSN